LNYKEEEKYLSFSIVNFYVLVAASVYFQVGLVFTCSALAFINSFIALYFGISDKLGYIFPIHYDMSWQNSLAINCLILIVFLYPMHFENGKNAALKRLAKQLLLAEEKERIFFMKFRRKFMTVLGKLVNQ
jgi:hypothetical protein